MTVYDDIVSKVFGTFIAEGETFESLLTHLNEKGKFDPHSQIEMIKVLAKHIYELEKK